MTVTNNLKTTNDFFNRLPGTWANRLGDEWHDTLGWNFISQPQKGNPKTGDFDIQFHQMLETITFKEIGTPRNVGITGEAGFWHAMAYEISINPSLPISLRLWLDFAAIGVFVVVTY